MKFTVQAACGCNTGKVRKNNEDNFFFNGKCLELENDGLRHPVILEEPLRNGFCVAVFDGMGGEHFGEHASFVAARQMQTLEKNLTDFFISEKTYLTRLAFELDRTVGQLQEELQTDHVGSTFVTLYFSGRYVYACNIGDSRAYRLREGEFLQLSVDHIEKRPGKGNAKAPLTQYLGFGSDEVDIDPHIAKGEIKKDDIYLLCSDGLTDMLTNFEITDIMLNSGTPESCVEALIQAAIGHGGRDNITAIVCKLV